MPETSAPPIRHLIPDADNFYFYESDDIVAQVPRSLIYEPNNPSTSWRYNHLYNEWIVKRCPWNKICNYINQIQHAQ